MESLKQMFDLRGRKALVTGSSQGIGRAIALGLAEFGADVMVHFLRDAEMAAGARRAIEAMGVQSGIVEADLGDPAAAAAIRDATRAAIGDPDIVILNASVQIRKRWQDVTPEEYRVQADTNFASCLWAIQTFSPAMRQRRWGRIVTVGSVQQVRPHPEMIVYSALKLALVNLVRSLAPDLAKDGVTINNLAPGAIETGRNEKVLADAEYRRKVESKIPLGYVGEARDCAGMALLLCSEAGRYITGQDMYVDGGMGLP